MIIGIDASRANNNQRTGVEEYAFQLIQNLKILIPENIRVILYTDKPLQNELAELPMNWTQKVLKWPPKRLWTQFRLSWEMFFNKPDVLFIPAHVAPIIHPQKTVMTIHDIAAVRFPKSYNWFERWYSIWSAKYAMKNLWKIIVPSKFVKTEIISILGTKNQEKIKVIYHGYNKNYQEKENNKIILEKYNLPKAYLISVGRLEEKKNTVGIIQAFEKLKMFSGYEDLNLVLVGKPGFGYQKVKKIIENSLFKKEIIITGWVDEEDLPEIIKNAKIFVFPSFYEGFGLPILEAFTLGVPVIASSNNCLKEIGEQGCLYIDPQNIAEITETIHKLLNDLELRNKLIILGKERLNNFSWKKSAQETCELLLSK